MRTNDRTSTTRALGALLSLAACGPGAPDSLSLKKVNGTSDCGSPMPLTNLSAFTQDRVRCVREFVELTAAETRAD